jgi:hypothetical protein
MPYRLYAVTQDEGPSLDTSKFSLYFSGSYIGTTYPGTDSRLEKIAWQYISNFRAQFFLLYMYSHISLRISHPDDNLATFNGETFNFSA